MNQKHYWLFDLDGTLIDSGPGITNCVAYALEKFDIHPAGREELYPYIGPPLVPSFQKYHGLTAEQAERALAYYRERYSVKGVFENEVYPGIPELLQTLRERGDILVVATAKPEEYTVRILTYLGLAEYFPLVCGNTMEEAHPTKASIIERVMSRYPDITADNARMVGDRKYDVEGAHACGLPAIGVLYGFGDRAELEGAGADTIVATVEELTKLLMEE